MDSLSECIKTDFEEVYRFSSKQDSFCREGMKTNGASKYAGDAVSNPADLGYRQLKISSSFEVPRTNSCCLSLKRNKSNYKVLNDIVAQVEFHQTIPQTRPLWQKRSLKQHVSGSGQTKKHV